MEQPETDYTMLLKQSADQTPRTLLPSGSMDVDPASAIVSEEDLEQIDELLRSVNVAESVDALRSLATQ
jgi:hypothetical protein